MSEPTPATLPKRLYSIAEFRAIGGCGRTRLYELAAAGILPLVKTAGGQTGIPAEAVDRYFNSARPIAEVKRSTAPGIAASLRSRAAR